MLKQKRREADKTQDAERTAREDSKKDFWDKSRVVTSWIALIAIPIVTVIIGNNITSAVRQREIDVRMVEVAIGILKSNPRESTVDPGLRAWAMEVVERYSEVKLPHQARVDLLRFPLPSTDGPQCSDRIDNDNDGLMDYPADPACSSPSDMWEWPKNVNPARPTQCSDKIDNDMDGLIDYPADPACISPLSESEWPKSIPPEHRSENAAQSRPGTTVSASRPGSGP